MNKIIINKHFFGEIEIPKTKNAWRIFTAVKKCYSTKESFGIHLLYGNKKLKTLMHYQQGGASKELEELEMYIELSRLLDFTASDAKKLKNEIEQINDSAHTHFNISKRLQCITKNKANASKIHYIFWDIENFANITAMFNHIIDTYDVPDEHIYLAANPDSLYLYKREWESELYDYGKNLHSFNFTKCDHGKNVADDVLLDQYQQLNPKNSNIYIMTYDRELKERFLEATHPSNHLFIMGK